MVMNTFDERRGGNDGGGHLEAKTCNGLMCFKFVACVRMTFLLWLVVVSFGELYLLFCLRTHAESFELPANT